MTVECGRARSGAGSVLRALVAFAVIGLFTSGCGNNNVTFGTAFITFSATPGPFTSYQVTLDSITLTRTDGSIAEPVGQSGGVSVPQVIDFQRLADQPEVFGAPAVPEGTYTSATVTIDYSTSYSPPLIYMDFGGKNIALSPYAPGSGSTAGTAAGTITYNVTFDPSAPVVIKGGVSTPIDFHFDLSGTSVINLSVAPPQVIIRPFIAPNTAPVYNQTLRSRGLFVTANPTTGLLIINTRPFYDVQSNPYGSLNVQTGPNTVFYVNGATYTGAAGVTALAALQLNTNVAVYGTVTNLAATTPTITATQVYAGLSLDNALEDRVIGTVIARSGNTITLHGASCFTRPGATIIGLWYFEDNLKVTVSDSTIVTLDGSSETLNQQAISVGQRIDVGGNLNDSSGNLVANTVNPPAVLDATSGLVRLSSTRLWGTLDAGAMAGAASLNLIAVGGFEPSVFSFTGTGQTSAMDANPASYVVNTAPASVDETGVAAGTLLRVDGTVAPFGAAPPDFDAQTVTAASATDQLLVVDWINGGTNVPFLNLSSSEIVVNMSNPNIGNSHFVQSGPVTVQNNSATTIDLTHPVANVTIVPDATVPGQFATNSAGALYVYNSYSSFATGIAGIHNDSLNIQKLLAVGHYDPATETFTAHRIDLLQE